MKQPLVLLAAALIAAITVVGAKAESPDGYLHSLAVPPSCPSAWTQPDPSLTICAARDFVPSVALTSQPVLVYLADYEANRADCMSYFAGRTTVITIDGSAVSVTTQPCRKIAQSVDNTITLPFFGASTVWGTSSRYLIPAGSLAPGDHTISITNTFTSDYTYTLGCGDPSGRCTVPAGTVWNVTTTLTIV